MLMIPDDFERGDFLKKFRRVVSATSNVTVQKGVCADGPHKRFKQKRFVGTLEYLMRKPSTNIDSAPAKYRRGR